MKLSSPIIISEGNPHVFLQSLSLLTNKRNGFKSSARGCSAVAVHEGPRWLMHARPHCAVTQIGERHSVLKLLCHETSTRK